MATTISPANAQKVWVFAQNPDGTLSPATIGGGGGGGTVTSIATSSPITGGPITTSGTIGCATCTTNAASLTSGNIVNGAGGQATVDSGIASANLITSAAVITNNVVPKGNGARGLVNSSITDNGTTVSTTEPFSSAGNITSGANGVAAGMLVLAGSTSGTTTLTTNATGATATLSSSLSVNGGNLTATNITAVTTLGFTSSTLFRSISNGRISANNNANSSNGLTRFTFGTEAALNPAFAFDGSTAVIKTADGSGTSANGIFSSAVYKTDTNCANGASPAVCAAASSGAVAIPAGTNSTLTINTTAITANSRVLLTVDPSVTISGTTCNTSYQTQPVVTSRVAGTSITIQAPGVSTTNPVCVSYMVFN